MNKNDILNEIEVIKNRLNGLLNLTFKNDMDIYTINVARFAIKEKTELLKLLEE